MKSLIRFLSIAALLLAPTLTLAQDKSKDAPKPDAAKPAVAAPAPLADNIPVRPESALAIRDVQVRIGDTQLQIERLNAQLVGLQAEFQAAIHAAYTAQSLTEDRYDIKPGKPWLFVLKPGALEPAKSPLPATK